MLRRHFITGEDKPDIIITYHSSKHIPFFGGKETKNLLMNANYYGDEENTDDFKSPISINIVLDTWNDGVGQWGIKFNDSKVFNYYESIGIPNNIYVAGSAESYIDFINNISILDNIGYIESIIFDKNITHINGSIIAPGANDQSILKEITLPNSLKYLTGNTFLGHKNLKSLIIPENVIRIDNLFRIYGPLSLTNDNLEEITLLPINPPLYNSDYAPLGSRISGSLINPNFKIKVYADCIDKYKNDTIWGQYSDLYDAIKNAVIYYEDDNRYVDYAEVINFGHYNNYKKLYITSETNNIESNLRWRSHDDIFIQNSIYDSRDNCHAVIKTETNELIKGSNKTVIPNSVIKIKSFAFYKNKLDTLNIPDSVTEAEYNVFDECEINNLIVGKNCIFAGDLVDSSCIFVNSIIISDDNPHYDNYNCNAFVAKNTMYRGCANTTIPEHINSLYGTFNNANYLTSYQIPNNIISLEKTFKNCNNLESIDLGNVQIINMETFYNCSKLKNINIPDTVSELNLHVFYNCELENIHIGSGLQFMTGDEDRVTFECSIIHNITISEDNQYFRIENNNLIQNYDNVLIKSFNDNNIISSSIEKIGMHAYYGMNINLINIPDNIKSIHYRAFDNTPLYENNYKDGMLIINDWLISINSLYFDNKSIIIPNNIHNIGMYNNYYPVKNITCEGNITNISDNAFYGKKIGQIYFISGNNLKYIGISAFQQSNIGFFNLVPGNETYISDKAFYACEELEVVTLYDKITYLGEYAFSNCTKLTQVELLNGKNYCTISEIKRGTFIGCSSLPSITIPSNINKIGDRVFENCTSLVDIYYKGTKNNWQAITKGEDWNRNVPATVVHCTDGDVEI